MKRLAVGGEPVGLADRKQWRFPRVDCRLETLVSPDGPVPVPTWVVGDGPTDQAFEDALQRAHDGFILQGSARPGQQAIIDLGTALLRRNYRLTVEEADWLLYEGFWQQARQDLALIGAVGVVTTTIMKLGFTAPLDRAEQLQRGLPPHQGQRFQTGAN